MSTPLHWHSRFAAGFVVVGLALSATGILYLVWTEVSVQTLPVKEGKAHAIQLSFELLFVIFMMFLLGSYAMVKIGRYFLYRPPPEERSEYVDAWSNYRVSDDEIKAAAAQWEPPGDSSPEADPDTFPPPAGR